MKIPFRIVECKFCKRKLKTTKMVGEVNHVLCVVLNTEFKRKYKK